MPPELWSIWTRTREQCCTPVGCTSSTPPTGQGQYQLAGSMEILLCTMRQCYRDPQGWHQENIVTFTCILTDKQLLQKTPKRIKWILLHVCTWTSTIEHAYSNCPRDKSGILLYTRTLIVEHNYHKAPRNKRFLINYNCYLFYLYLKNREMNLTSL